MYLNPGQRNPAHLNLGILAHVDAGKTSLTERLLYAAGVIDTVGRVDDGNTQTDSLALEKQRGITIKAAVVSFALGDVTVNLIDTPGHPDFIAEVERVLGVLDGVVLVISAVESVQVQTRVLWRALQRPPLPTLLFVNKIDRRGAQDVRLFQRIAEKLTPDILAMGRVEEIGARAATFTPYGPADAHFTAAMLEQLTEHDDGLLAAYLEDETSVSYTRLSSSLAAQTKRALIHPVFFGSAMTGAGIEALISGIQTLLPAPCGDADAPVSGTVFKLERGPAGEKVAYVRILSGALRVRDTVTFGRGKAGKVTAIHVFENGADVQRPAVHAGQIAKLWGLAEIQIGDALGARPASAAHHFAPPTLETVIMPRHLADKAALHHALGQLAEGDPLINLRQDDATLSLSLYGEVQKEVIQATLENDFGLQAVFRETTPICTERLCGTGAAVETLGASGNPFLATVGLRLEPAPLGSGVTLGLEADVSSLPHFIYGSAEAFRLALLETVQETLRQGLYGWQVMDCRVSLTHSGYASPVSTAGDFRKLTPLVLMRGLAEAGTQVCEPLHHFVLELPASTLGPVSSTLARLHAVPRTTLVQGSAYVLEGEIPAAKVYELQRVLPALTGGEGVLESTFSHYQPIAEPFPTRPRSEPDPLNRKAYLTQLVGFWGAKGHHVH